MRQGFVTSVLLSLLIALLATTVAFVPISYYPSPSSFRSQCDSRDATSTTSLNRVIKGEEVDAEIFDPGQGGVTLAQESAVKIVGTVNHKPGSADPKPMELVRYTNVKEVSEDNVNQYSPSVKIVSVGNGKEMYSDPAGGVDKTVVYAPLDAVRDATMGLGTTQNADKVVINFLGGDDLQMKEVLNGIQQMVINLDVKTSTKISFNSLSYKSFPLEQATLTIVAVAKSEGAGGEEEKLRGVDKPLSEGEVYFQNGKYFTVVEEDITDAIA